MIVELVITRKVKSVDHLGASTSWGSPRRDWSSFFLAFRVFEKIVSFFFFVVRKLDAFLF